MCKCTKRCDFCVFVIFDQYYVDNGENTILEIGEPVGCALWEDKEHQIKAKSYDCCEDFQCRECVCEREKK